MTEGCAVAPVRGMPEELEASARVRLEGLREEAARLAEVWEAAEIELDRRVIAREGLVEALALSASETTAVTEAEEETVPSPLSHVELATSEWVDWYNHRRLHGEIGHIPPADYEADFYRATTNLQVTANT